MCHIEADCPSLSHVIKNKQHKKMWTERAGMNDDPLIFATKLALNSNTQSSRLISKYITRDVRGDETDRH